MTKKLYIIFFCISGICFGSLQAYPMRDTSTDEDLHQENHEVRRLGSISSTQFSKPSLASSRLDRLLGSYMNLLRPEMKGSSGNAVSDAKERDNIANVAGYASDYFHDVLSNNIASRKSSHQTFPNDANNEYNDIGSEKSKREQGWYIQYGKRTNEKMFSPHHKDQQPIEIALENPDDITYNTNQSPSLLTTSLESKTDKPMTAFVRHIVLLSADPMGTGTEEDSDSGTSSRNDASNGKEAILKSENWNSEQWTRNTKRGHQGWYTQYGKRADGDLHLYVL